MSSMDIISAHPGNRGARLTPKRSAILISCAGGATYGLAAGIIGGVNDAIVKARYFPDEADNTQAVLGGVLVSCLLVGAFVGCFLGVDFSNRFGRRISFRITAINCIVMSVLLAVLPGFPLLIITRTLLGLSVGLSAVLVPSFVNDSVDKSVSGSIGTIFQINICAWILLAQIVNYVCHPGASKTDVHVDEWNWRLQLALSAVPGLMMLVLSFIMHESPVYLQTLADKERLLDGGSGGLSPVASAGLSDDTEFQNSAKLNNDGGVVAAADEKPKVLGMRDLFTRENIKYVAIALILSSSQQLTGINGIIFYAPGIFKSADMANPLVLTFAVVGTWNLLSVFISFALVDRLGRRVLMLSALAVMAIGAGLMSLAYQAFDAHKGPIAIVALLLFVGAFECGPGPLFFVMAVESYPAHLRDAALSLTQSSVWVFSIIITFGFPVLDSGLGTAATFLIFFITSVLSFILTWWRVPEPHSHSHGHCDTDNAPVKSSSDRAALSDGASGYGTAAYQQL